MTHKYYRFKRWLAGATQPRFMYDGINADAPAIAKAFPNTPMVAGYIDGNYAWSQTDWDLFPHALHVYITVFSNVNAGDVIDCETGDATPDAAAAWVRMRRAAGYYRPTVYCNLSTAPAVRIATGSLILSVDYDMWVADWTGRPQQIRFQDGRTAAATQFSSPSGGFYDESVVYDGAWPHRHNSPPPPPNPSPVWHEVPDGNTMSLDALAASRHTSVEHITAVTRANADPTNVAIYEDYLALDTALYNTGKPHAAMPAKMVYYTEYQP